MFLIGLAMSADAFAAAIGKGAASKRPGLLEALRAGVIFGVIEGLTPVVGWMIGAAAVEYIAGWDHWVAFALLCLLGIHMIHAGLSPDVDSSAEAPSRHGFWNLAATGFATSIDAMVVGVGLALIGVPIAVVALVIGLTTLVMVTIGMLLGNVLGTLVGKRAEIVGGAILIVIGTTILFQHLHESANA